MQCRAAGWRRAPFEKTECAQAEASGVSAECALHAFGSEELFETALNAPAAELAAALAEPLRPRWLPIRACPGVDSLEVGVPSLVGSREER